MRETTFQIESYLRPGEAFHFARKTLATRFPERAHGHDFFEVFLVESGRLMHWIGGTTQVLEPGQLCFIRPRDVHALRADRGAPCQIVNVMFRAETAAHLATRYADELADRYFDAKTPLPEVHMLAPDRFARALAVAGQLQTAPRTLARIEEFLLVLANRVADPVSHVDANAPRWFAEACSAAQSREVFAQGAAGFIAAAGRSHEHVCRTCKAVTGKTPSEYVNAIRLDHAAQLLRSDELSIDAVAETCGFENTSYFYRLFRAQHGTTPRRYRQHHLKDPF